LSWRTKNAKSQGATTPLDRTATTMVDEAQREVIDVYALDGGRMRIKGRSLVRVAV